MGPNGEKVRRLTQNELFNPCHSRHNPKVAKRKEKRKWSKKGKERNGGRNERRRKCDILSTTTSTIKEIHFTIAMYMLARLLLLDLTESWLSLTVVSCPLSLYILHWQGSGMRKKLVCCIGIRTKPMPWNIHFPWEEKRKPSSKIEEMFFAN